MNIQVNENGNFAFIQNNKIKLITSTFNVHQHPRDKEVILFNNSFKSTEEGSLVVKFSDLTINGIKPPIQNIDYVKGVLFTDVPLRPHTQPTLTRDNDPNYLVFKLQDTYEKLLTFLKANVYQGFPKEYNDSLGKLTKIEYYCEFQTFHVRVTLNYNYLASNPAKVSHILMSGHTEFVNLPLKAYHYDAQGNKTYTYEVFSWQRLTSNE
ncbi:hypothetical protein SAMN04489761_4657 [Tenacibaculum sp. MAR_2009_124]|uniref:hypothetical protein n=1 Tax=Tenacibaculum sp. MAR_2009_124 TaxID=1250059 RepID=UPI0008949BB4|nr:hypothetical protein [Tenacibaculum sp. MAR_2009_124]SED21719.1 hypothetical protein SAMN04489761_4657 [Tenacibaculum sp. MAR_2009_124]